MVTSSPFRRYQDTLWNKKSVNQDSSLLVCKSKISCKVDDKVFANAGLALAGIW